MTLLFAFLFLVTTKAIASSPTGWFEIPQAGFLDFLRGGTDFPGEAEMTPPLADVILLGEAVASLNASWRRTRARSDRDSWDHGVQRFSLHSAVARPNGVVMAMDAIDLRPTTEVRRDGGSLRSVEPEGGVRLGLAVDALRPWFHGQRHVAGLGVWVPILDAGGETELQAGWRRGRRFRVDLIRASRTLDSRARLVTVADSKPDTLRLRADQVRWTLRTGGMLGKTRIQVWAGRRTLDPGTMAPGWNLTSRSHFGGMQASTSFREWSMDGELRAESGNDTAQLVRGEARLGSQARHRTEAGRLEILAPTGRMGSPVLIMETARATIEASGEDSIPAYAAGVTIPDRPSGQARLERAGLRLGWQFLSDHFDVRLLAGLGLLRSQGAWPALWTGLGGDLAAMRSSRGATEADLRLEGRWGASGTTIEVATAFAPFRRLNPRMADPRLDIELRQVF